jgi:hypothetical protein
MAPFGGTAVRGGFDMLISGYQLGGLGDRSATQIVVADGKAHVTTCRMMQA